MLNKITSPFSRISVIIKYLFILPCCLLQLQFLFAQTEIPSSEIIHQINGLKKVGTVMYIAAHPDDENTRLIAYLSKGEHLRTTYLSLTRGDGGQNLIGTEKGDLLGVVRTHELSEARKKDGGEQYFSRAVDFGYSKTAEETFDKWNKEEVLKDVVWNIRRIKPDMIITRFPPDFRGGHGHHTASAILAMEAFKAAADKKFKFNDSRDGKLPVWQAKRVVWNTSWWAYRRSGEEFPPKGVLELEVGGYDHLLGTSYNSIASRSRSTHLSQGFGTTIARGSETEYFEHLAGDSAEKHVFEDIDFSWYRFGSYKLAKKIEAQIDKTLAKFDPSYPSQSIVELIDLKKLIGEVENTEWKKYKQRQIDNIIAHCAGLWLELAPNNYYATHGDTAVFTLQGLNRSQAKVIAKNMAFVDETRTLDDKNLEFNKTTELTVLKKYISGDIEISQPYWLAIEKKGDLFAFKNPEDIGWVDKQPFGSATVWLEIEGETVELQVPIKYKWSNGAIGELTRPFEIRSRISLNFQHPFYLFSNSKSREIELQVTANKKGINTSVSLELPKGWSVSPKSQTIKSEFDGEVINLKFTVTPNENAKEGNIKAIAIEQGYEHHRSIIEIDYSHIPAQVYQPEASARIDFEPIKITDKKIAYIPGAGDDVAQSLQSIGYTVNLIPPASITSETFDNYDVVIVGIRAFNTLDEMPNIYTHLLTYCEKGGKVIVQYNTTRGIKTPEVGPHGLMPSRDRITDEYAELKILKPDHPIFNSPNKISSKDFENWVQERGLYFPHEFYSAYTPLLAGNDKGEETMNGALLVCDYGKGQFVYTGLSFFRELPAGVTGAYKIMVNLIEY